MRKLDEFPAAPNGRYPWDQLLNGEAWELTLREDFTSRPATVIANARYQAKRRNGAVRTRLLTKNDRQSVVVQFVRD